MALNFVNPYSGEPDQTCSVSFAAQQDMAGGVSSPQTEAQFNQSKMLGEWGVIKAKLAKGQIPHGTKVLSYTNPNSGSRGYFFVKGSSLYQQAFTSKGVKVPATKVEAVVPEAFITSKILKASIPQAVAPNPKPEPVVVQYGDPGFVQANKSVWSDGHIIAVNANGQQYLKFNKGTNKIEVWSVGTDTGTWSKTKEATLLSNAMDDAETWHKPDGSTTTSSATPATVTPPAPPTQVAAPTPSSPVNPGSTSVGSMSHEDVSAMFVKIKDDLAKQKGLNIKGANTQLDQEVYAAIGAKTGYTAEEVKGKIDAYKAAGNKLSALKKKVMAGTKKVPEGNPQPTHATPAAPLNVGVATNTPASDPKPHGVPTVATPALAHAIKNDVAAAVNANPGKVYSDEDVAAAYIIAKDKVVAESNGKWTLYTKSDELDAAIADEIKGKTGLSPDQQKQKIANYLATGKKLSALKKQLAKQGAFTPKADTLKKSGSALTQAEKDALAASHAANGYTPTPTPATGTPPTSTGSPPPAAVKKKAQESGDITGISDALKKLYFDKFKQKGSQSYLSSDTGSNYEGLASTLAEMKMLGHSKDLTLLQLVRVVDEYGAQKAGVANGHLFEEKVVKWLTTPAGTKYVKDKAAEIAKAAEAANKKAELEKQAKLLEANQPPLPADSALFQDWSLEKAKRISRTWLAAKPWDDRQQRDLKYYTTNAYTRINGYLRGTNPNASTRVKNAVVGARAGMRPTTEPILVKRGTGLNQFTSLGVGSSDASLIWGITGKTFKDEGFLSTSAGGRAAFGGAALLEIECPVGTPMAYVDPISAYPGENEMLLQAGMEYKVLNVRKQDGTFVVRLRVVNWPGKAS